MRILLVEDISVTRELTRFALEELGHEVIEATTGNQAVQTAVANRPDCILMDLDIPQVDGLLATAALRTILPLRSVPIVALTAYPKQLSEQKAIDAGCNACVEKPLMPEALAAVLDDLFE